MIWQLLQHITGFFIYDWFVNFKASLAFKMVFTVGIVKTQKKNSVLYLQEDITVRIKYKAIMSCYIKA